MPPKYQTARQQRVLQESDSGEADDGAAATCCQECTIETPVSERPELIRIATWAGAAPALQAYLDTYQQEAVIVDSSPSTLPDDESSGNTKDPATSILPRQLIRITVLPSLQELNEEIRHDLRTSSKLYDGFVVIPPMMGDLLQFNGLKTLNFQEATDSMVLAKYFQDLLPYYRNQVATLEGRILGLPLGSSGESGGGNQLLLLYRKDYLASQPDLPLPTTWGEYIRIAEALHEQPIGTPTGNVPIYGSCLGRSSEAMCREKTDRDGGSCESLSLAYLGMTLAPMTQLSGPEDGWLFDSNVTMGMRPLLSQSLERSLVFFENQLNYGAPDELTSDASMNLDLFRQGRCAMTITADHPNDVLQDERVGFLPVPGSHSVLDRSTNTMTDCTTELCPHGIPVEDWGIVNQAPYGVDNLMVGVISTVASDDHTTAIMDFFSFIADKELTAPGGQPMTYSGLQNSTIDGYEDLIRELAASNNAATPLRVPTSFRLLSEVDNHVYKYLAEGSFSDSSRQSVRESIEASMDRIIVAHDEVSFSLPTTTLYQKSLGTFTPEYRSDIYIGDIWRYIGWSFGGVSCLCSIFFALWAWRYQHEPVVLATQTIFLYMICGGTFLMAGTIFTFGIEDDIADPRNVERSCMASMWLYALGYSLIFSAHFSKIWRINRVFRSARNLQRIKIESVDILVPLLILLGINCTLLTTWTITDRMIWVRDPIYDPATSLTPEEIPTFGYCDSENYRVYLGLMLGINYILSLVALVQAYEIRKITTDYGESLWISGALACAVQVWTIGLPLLKLLDDNPRAIFFVKAVVVFATTMSSLLLIFVPKMRYLRESWREPQGPDYFGLSKDSVTSQDHSHASDDTHRNPAHKNGLRVNGARSSGLERPSTASDYKPRLEDLEGIRIIQSSSRHSEEVERLQRSLKQAEKRHRSLHDRLERIQEKLEQYIVSNHPNAHDNTNFILAARSELTRISG